MEAESLGNEQGMSDESSEEVEELDEFDNLGYEAIDRSCRLIYPDQPNPLQSLPAVKIWLGGPDPIDFIRIYSNEGDSQKMIPAHWHYITFGFSDLYGDERVHRLSGQGESSGFGFELTFRLKREAEDVVPPRWPVSLINRLAKYVFQTGNVLHVGDHIPWHNPLNNESYSRVEHLLVCEDPQLLNVDTPYGSVEFRQIVGVMSDEIKAAQRWKGAGMLQLLYETTTVGPFFVTDMDRDKSVFEMRPELRDMVTEGIEKDGSNLGHVTAVFTWTSLAVSGSDEEIPQKMIKQEKETADDNCKEIVLKGEHAEEDNKDEDTLVIETIDAVHLCFDAEAAQLLPIVVRGRLKKGRFFIFRNAKCMAVHLVPTSDEDEEVSANNVKLLQAMGTNLQICCSPSFVEQMSSAFEELKSIDQDLSKYPKEFQFSNPSIRVSVYPRGKLTSIKPDSPSLH